MNIWHLLEIASELEPTRPIITDAAGSLTLGELRLSAQCLAGALATAPPGPVGFIGMNNRRFPIALFAAALAGRPLAVYNYRADKALVAHFIDATRPAVAIADERSRHLLPDDLPILDEWARTTRLPAGPLGDDSVALYVFTSGTSTAPKAVVLTHAQLSSYVMATTEPIAAVMGSATLVAAPNYHIAAATNTLTSTFAGRRMVFLDAFSPEAWLATVRSEAITHAFVVPTMLHRVVGNLRGRTANVPSLDVIAYGGAPCARATIEAALKVFPRVGFVNAYGLTETSSTIALLTPEDHRTAYASSDPAVRARLSSVGKPVPAVQVRIGGDGEILVRGPQVSGLYAGGSSRVDDQGWFHTGDRGRFDIGGYLFITGRLDDMIIRGGENISPVEIEEVLRGFPGVEDAAVVGIEDAEWGQRVAAAVEGATVDVERLQSWLEGSLPSFKRPTLVVYMDRLPRNDLGKVVRREVRAALSDKSLPASQ